MDKIKNDLLSLWMRCDFTDQWGDMDDPNIYNESLDKIDEILNIIESTNVKDVQGCRIAIERMKNIIDDGEVIEYEDSVQEN